jgi:hypothetical protein
MKAIENPLPLADEVISEVRRHKLAIAEQHGFDIDSLLQSLRKREAGDPRFVNSVPTKKA